MVCTSLEAKGPKGHERSTRSPSVGAFGHVGKPTPLERGRPQGLESSTLSGSAFGSVAEMADCAGPETRRTFETASCAFESRRFLPCQCGVTAAAAV